MARRGTGKQEDATLTAVRRVIAALIEEVGGLREDVVTLQTQNAQLKAENGELRDEIARLKGLPPRPKFKGKPSGMEKATSKPAGSKGEKRGRGTKRDKLAVTSDVKLKAQVPPGSRFRGYEDVLVQDLRIAVEVTRYRRERWETATGERIVAAMPAGIVGGFGPELRRFILAGHFQGQVTSERLTALLNGMGLDISKRQVVRLLSQNLEALGIDRRKITPDPVRIATEGATWGTIRAHGLLPDTVIVSDDAGQFRLADHGLCWVHAERLVFKLQPSNPAFQKAVDLTRTLIWWFYADLKAYKREPDRKRARMLRARFDRIFTKKTGYVMLDRLLARLHARKAELLRVLDRPDIPLHTNGSENDIRSVVTKRKISGGTVSERGKIARDVMLGLIKTCAKLDVSFYRLLGDRLTVPNAPHVPRLPGLVRLVAA